LTFRPLFHNLLYYNKLHCAKGAPVHYAVWRVSFWLRRVRKLQGRLLQEKLMSNPWEFVLFKKDKEQNGDWRSEITSIFINFLQNYV
jgi:hypothetical protein